MHNKVVYFIIHHQLTISHQARCYISHLSSGNKRSGRRRLLPNSLILLPPTRRFPSLILPLTLMGRTSWGQARHGSQPEAAATPHSPPPHPWSHLGACPHPRPQCTGCWPGEGPPAQPSKSQAKGCGALVKGMQNPFEYDLHVISTILM